MANDTEKTRRLIVFIPVEMSRKVDALAKEDGVTRSHIGRRALKKYLEATCASPATSK